MRVHMVLRLLVMGVALPIPLAQNTFSSPDPKPEMPQGPRVAVFSEKQHDFRPDR